MHQIHLPFSTLPRRGITLQRPDFLSDMLRGDNKNTWDASPLVPPPGTRKGHHYIWVRRWGNRIVPAWYRPSGTRKGYHYIWVHHGIIVAF